MIGAIGNVGGLYSFVIVFFAWLSWFFSDPYRDLHLALRFNEMKNRICRQEGLLKEDENIDMEFDEHIGL